MFNRLRDSDRSQGARKKKEEVEGMSSGFRRFSRYLAAVSAAIILIPMIANGEPADETKALKYLEGNVIQAKTKTPLQGYTVTATDINSGSMVSPVVTDEKGYFKLVLKKPGTYQVTVITEGTGYLTESTLVIVTGETETMELATFVLTTAEKAAFLTTTGGLLTVLGVGGALTAVVLPLVLSDDEAAASPFFWRILKFDEQFPNDED